MMQPKHWVCWSVMILHRTSQHIQLITAAGSSQYEQTTKILMTWRLLQSNKTFSHIRRETCRSGRSAAIHYDDVCPRLPSSTPAAPVILVVNWISCKSIQWVLKHFTQSDRYKPHVGATGDIRRQTSFCVCGHKVFAVFDASVVWV